MKYVLISDIHGVAGCLEEALKRYDEEKADALILLGDLIYHGPRNGVPEGYDPIRTTELLNARKKDIICVRGNCDADVDQMMMQFAITAKYMILPVKEEGCDPYRMVLTHGHHPVEDFCVQEGDVLISGHTHVLKAEKRDNYFHINPGSVSLPKEGNPRTYAVIEGRCVRIKTLGGEVIKEERF